jgi:hypothetical protein
MVVGFDDGDNDIEVLLDDGRYIYVPYTVLEKVQSVAYPDLAKALESVGITILETTLQGNHITIEGVIR